MASQVPGASPSNHTTPAALTPTDTPISRIRLSSLNGLMSSMSRTGGGTNDEHFSLGTGVQELRAHQEVTQESGYHDTSAVLLETRFGDGGNSNIDGTQATDFVYDEDDQDEDEEEL